MKPLALKLHPDDTVAVAITPLMAGMEVTVDGDTVTIADDIPRHHKLSLEELDPGQSVLKYGQPIGRVTEAVSRGSWVHSHNLKTMLSGVVDYAYDPLPIVGQQPHLGSTFEGFRRSNGSVGTRNEIWILPTVACVSHAAETIARICSQEVGERLDGIYVFGHPFGCSQFGDDLDNTRRVLAGLMQNPNAGGVLLIGLGCEDNQLDIQLDAAGDIDRSRLRYFNSQDVPDEIEHGVNAVRELVAVAEHDRRTVCGLSDLVIGLECGGSDALSGITANPLVGQIADRIVAEGGSAILTEVPEMFGAEQTLMNRAESEEVFADIVELIETHKRHFTDLEIPIYDNPSPGNLAGGLTSLEEKSLGAIRKGGSSQITEVLCYGCRKKTPGLALLDAPGNDLVSSTALVAAGATVLLFTTGRGTPLGSPVPTIKISTNTEIFERKPAWIDFNAGSIADGTAEIDDMETDLFELVLHVASGHVQTANELRGNREIGIWKTGVTH